MADISQHSCLLQPGRVPPCSASAFAAILGVSPRGCGGPHRVRKQEKGRKAHSDGLQPSSVLAPNSDGLQPITSDGLRFLEKGRLHKSSGESKSDQTPYSSSMSKNPWSALVRSCLCQCPCSWQTSFTSRPVAVQRLSFGISKPVVLCKLGSAGMGLAVRSPSKVNRHQETPRRLF